MKHISVSDYLYKHHTQFSGHFIDVDVILMKSLPDKKDNWNVCETGRSIQEWKQ